MIRQFPISVRLRPIDHGEDDIETTEQRGREVDLFRDVLVLVEPAELRIRGGEDRASRLEDGRDSCFSDTNPLLFHRFMDRGSILRVHLFDFVDACKSEIRKDQRTRFEGPTAFSEFIANGAGRKSGCG